jgi:extracellular factor (EF) 3-hydroxypalmitic acid methyl ester biosynthesis protein
MPVNTLSFLTASDQQRLFEKAQHLVYHRGDPLFREGDPQPGLYVIRTGLVRVERQHQGQSLAVARYGAGDVVGEVSFLKQHKALGTVVAEEDVEADYLERSWLDHLLESDSAFAARFYHSLALCLGERLVQILPGLQLPEAFGGARPQAPRAGQLSAQQIPSALSAGVGLFRATLDAIATRLLREPPALAQAQQIVNATCDDLVHLLQRFTQADALEQIALQDLQAVREKADLARGVGGYVFRQTFPLFLQSATIAQAYAKESGRFVDRDLLERIETNEPEGDGDLGRLIDRWFLDLPLCRARRSQVREATAFLQQIASDASRPEPLRITSLSAGTATEVFHLLAATSRPVLATCIDNDPDALLYNAERARDLDCSEQITFLQVDLLAVVQGRAGGSLGLQHAIYGLGVCDYLTDDQVLALLNWAHEQLEAGGWLLLTSRDAGGRDRVFAEHILDWPIIWRTPEQLRALAAQSRLPSADVRPVDGGETWLVRLHKLQDAPA